LKEGRIVKNHGIIRFNDSYTNEVINKLKDA